MGVDARIYTTTEKPRLNLRDDACRLAEAVDRDFFWIKEPDRHALSEAEHPDLRGYVYKVNTFSRYYGPQYERGSWPMLYSIMMWLSYNFKGKVYYGPDINDKLIVMSDKTMSDMWIHWCRHGGQPYFQRTENYAKNTGPSCEFCAGRPLSCCGSKGVETIWVCLSCGKEIIC